MTIAELLVPFQLSEDDFARALAADLQATPDASATGLTADEESILARHGGIASTGTGGGSGDAKSSGRKTLQTFSANLAEQTRASISVSQAAERLAIDASRIRHRLRDHALYGFKIGAGSRLPLWQFDDRLGTPIPGLRAVLAALPAGLHPLEVAGFMTTPDPGLTISDESVDPRRWLLEGGDVAMVCVVAHNLDTW